MRLDEVLTAVRGSATSHWNKMSCWGAGCGPSYRYQFAVSESHNQPNSVFIDSHPYAAAYRPNLSITMAWGLDSNKNFREEWANQFPDPQASSEFVDIVFNGALVFRLMYVTVDGGRAFLPLPEPNGATVSEEEYDLVRVIHELTNGVPFDDYFSRAKFQIGRSK
jgi:hypothetical protein